MIARISFLTVVEAWFINDRSMYLQAPKRMVCNVSTGIDLNEEENTCTCRYLLHRLPNTCTCVIVILLLVHRYIHLHCTCTHVHVVELYIVYMYMYIVNFLYWLYTQ